MKISAEARYMSLTSDREQFLTAAREAAKLTLPYLITDEGLASGEKLHTPWQSVGAKGVNVLASKMMLSLFPVSTTFFKLQINDAELSKLPNVDDKMRSDIDLSLSKMERIIMQQISETTDRVQLHTAMKHLVTTGNVLIYQGKKNLKLFPLDRYVIARDGEGVVQEIITKEIVDRSQLPKEFQKPDGALDANSPGEDGPKFGVASRSNKGQSDDAVVFTHCQLQDGAHKWYQQCEGKIIPGSQSSSPVKTSPWTPLRFNVCDGESYGRGRVEEFIGDLSSLETLMKALVEGSAAAAKVVFMVSPSSTTKPQSLATASSGAIIQGRPDDVGVVQVNKGADFSTVQAMIGDLTRRLSDAFLVLQVRQSERTTAAEVQAVQQELNEQLGGIYSNLTTELLTPYLARKLALMARSKVLPPLPKGLVMPTVVAGLNGIGRGQDRATLMEFAGTIGQLMGPEVMAQFLNPDEFIKRLAAASGIEALGLIKSPDQMAQEKSQAQQQMITSQVMGQMGQLAKSPVGEQMTQQMMEQAQNGQQQQPNPEAPQSPQG